MTISLIIIMCVLVLLAYLFDLTASITKIPSVILLLILGFLVKLTTNLFHINIPNLNPILPLLGTIGLILIVLEGSLDLEINKQKLTLILKSFMVAFLPLIVLSFGIAYFLNFFFLIPFKVALANTIPLSIISSAIAIPSARNLPQNQKEFVTYESSLSDIIGVIFFNFITLNDHIGTKTFGYFTIEMLIMLIISFGATLLLSNYLNKIKHHIKFIPIIISVVLIYTISKIYHLPGLIFILIFGLFLGNINQLRFIKFIQHYHPVNFFNDVIRFREITTELAFLVRALFFILFGFLIDFKDVFNTETIFLAFGITIFIFLLRYLILYFFKVSTKSLTFIAPRGLITILLFLSIPAAQQTPFINNSLIIQVILFTVIIMMVGMLKSHKTTP